VQKLLNYPTFIFYPIVEGVVIKSLSIYIYPMNNA
jgi:hypothetical protein